MLLAQLYASRRPNLTEISKNLQEGRGIFAGILRCLSILLENYMAMQCQLRGGGQVGSVLPPSRHGSDAKHHNHVDEIDGGHQKAQQEGTHSGRIIRATLGESGKGSRLIPYHPSA
jgi:hypothetical protein